MGDLTRTVSISNQYARKLRGQFTHLRARIRHDISDRDVFGLMDNSHNASQHHHHQQRTPIVNLARSKEDVRPIPSYEFATSGEKAAAFEEWWERASDDTVLNVIEPDENQYVRSAYTRGMTDADAKLRQAGIAVPDVELTAALRMPIHRDTLELMYTRNFTQLRGITRDTGVELSRVLTDGLAEGENARVIGRNISREVDNVGRRRADLLARTEVQNTHHTSSIRRYDQTGVTHVDVLTNPDACDRCMRLEQGNPYPIANAESLLPHHPNCRCTTAPLDDPADSGRFSWRSVAGAA